MTISSAQQKGLNAIIYFATHINPLTFSKAMHLLYLADECAVRRSGVPITWLDYIAWKSGPVPEGLYNMIKQAKSVKFPASKQLDDMVLLSIKSFNDCRFSDFEILILQDVVVQYGKYSTEQLVNQFRQKESFVVDFTVLLDSDFKKAAFEVAYQFHLVENL